MKTFILFALLGMIAEPPSSFAVCGVYIKNQAKVSNLIGFHELESALEKRGYYIRPEGYEDIELELDIQFHNVQVCYSGHPSFLEEVSISFNELFNSPVSMEIKAHFPKTNEEFVYEKKLPLYNRDGAQERRAIRKLIRDLPRCETKLNN